MTYSSLRKLSKHLRESSFISHRNIFSKVQKLLELSEIWATWKPKSHAYDLGKVGRYTIIVNNWIAPTNPSLIIIKKSSDLRIPYIFHLWAFPSIDKNQNIPTVLTWHFHDNDQLLIFINRWPTTKPLFFFCVKDKRVQCKWP